VSGREACSESPSPDCPQGRWMATPRSHFRSEDVKASLSCSRHALSQVASVANGIMPTASLLLALEVTPTGRATADRHFAGCRNAACRLPRREDQRCHWPSNLILAIRPRCTKYEWLSTAPPIRRAIASPAGPAIIFGPRKSIFRFAGRRASPRQLFSFETSIQRRKPGETPGECGRATRR
jgi:hypothetical protein